MGNQPKSNVYLIEQEGIRQGYKGRPLKRFVHRTLQKIVKKALKGRVNK